MVLANHDPTRRRGHPPVPVLVLIAALALGGCAVDVRGVPPGSAPAAAPAAPAGAPSSACGAGGRTVPLQVAHPGGSTLPLVEVTLHGQGPFLFALDTGAASSVVDTRLADRLGLVRSGTSRPVTGAVGAQDAPLARVESWRLGDVELNADEVVLIDLPGSQGGANPQGLIGSDVLSGFGCIAVNYTGRQLELPATAGTLPAFG